MSLRKRSACSIGTVGINGRASRLVLLAFISLGVGCSSPTSPGDPAPTVPITPQFYSFDTLRPGTGRTAPLVDGAKGEIRVVVDLNEEGSHKIGVTLGKSLPTSPGVIGYEVVYSAEVTVTGRASVPFRLNPGLVDLLVVQNKSDSILSGTFGALGFSQPTR